MTAVMANPPGPSLIETLTQEASGNLSFRYAVWQQLQRSTSPKGSTSKKKFGIGNEGGMPGALETGLLCLGFCPACPFTFFCL